MSNKTKAAMWHAAAAGLFASIGAFAAAAAIGAALFGYQSMALFASVVAAIGGLFFLMVLLT